LIACAAALDNGPTSLGFLATVKSTFIGPMVAFPLFDGRLQGLRSG